MEAQEKAKADKVLKDKISKVTGGNQADNLKPIEKGVEWDIRSNQYFFGVQFLIGRFHF